MMRTVQPLVILLVEDDAADVKLIRLSLKEQKLANDVCAVSSGEEAFDFLRHQGKYASGAPKPDLILLDLNMPGMGGKEFLRRLKLDEELKPTPVIILTTSDAERDIIDSYRLQASGYVHKPVSLNEFKQVMQKIEAYWFMLCKLPPRED